MNFPEILNISVPILVAFSGIAVKSISDMSTAVREMRVTLAVIAEKITQHERRLEAIEERKAG